MPLVFVKVAGTLRADLGPGKRCTFGTGTIKGAKTETHLLNVCCSAARLVGGIEERSALILFDDMRNAAIYGYSNYVHQQRLCTRKIALACEISSGVDEGLQKMSAIFLSGLADF
ncbi:hypothetical protein AVEN_48928-1 [Araneus ventricosus]|uniref:Uncharacterized protein n=1 Tax=Araneus ventricosus TaxID=182803 RepID=A0A4Y2AGL1_ARAVE|nr:hypothetical protein AVEN_48928-1 [Araneus ventricosus]